MTAQPRMTAEQKRRLAKMLLDRAGSLVEFWSEEVKSAGGLDGPLGSVSAEQVSRQLGVWLYRLPGDDWDDRLALPDKD